VLICMLVEGTAQLRKAALSCLEFPKIQEQSRFETYILAACNALVRLEVIGPQMLHPILRE